MLYYDLLVQYSSKGIDFNVFNFLDSIKQKSGVETTPQCSDDKSQTDQQGIVYLLHELRRKFAYLVLDSTFVNGTYLFQQYNGCLWQATFVLWQFNVCGQLCFFQFAGSCRRNDGRAVFVSHVVLQHKYRAYSSLFATYHGIEICVVKFATSNHAIAPLLS